MAPVADLLKKFGGHIIVRSWPDLYNVCVLLQVVAGLDLIGLEPEGLWSCLIMAASFPAWLHAPLEPHMVVPMSWQAALKVIQRCYKVCVCVFGGCCGHICDM